METSAFQKINIDKAFVTMVEEIFKKYEKLYTENFDEEFEGNHNVVNLGSGQKKENKDKKPCCPKI